MQKINELLKVSDSIRIEMIPGSANDLEMKTFNWTLEVFDDT